MLRTPARAARSLRTPPSLARTGAVRRASSSPFPDDEPPPPPPPSYITAATVYPFILLSAITSLALNLGHQRTARETEGAHFRAQISVLETLVNRLRDQTMGRTLTADEQEEVERELELVGLGRGKGKKTVDAEGDKKDETSWTEVFFGKKGKAYEEEDTTDWEKVFREAEEAEQRRIAAGSAEPTSAVAAVSPTAAAAAPPSTPSPAPVSSAPSPAPTKPSSRPVYL
ncbi:hypothetical protein JCM10207_005288 [Rhodosporidiobolus poonsookiae]